MQLTDNKLVWIVIALVAGLFLWAHVSTQRDAAAMCKAFGPDDQACWQFNPTYNRP